MSILYAVCLLLMFIPTTWCWWVQPSKSSALCCWYLVGTDRTDFESYWHYYTDTCCEFVVEAFGWHVEVGYFSCISLSFPSSPVHVDGWALLVLFGSLRIQLAFPLLSFGKQFWSLLLYLPQSSKTLCHTLNCLLLAFNPLLKQGLVSASFLCHCMSYCLCLLQGHRHRYSQLPQRHWC